jgi:membrane-associated phospholipid phosphatase
MDPTRPEIKFISWLQSLGDWLLPFSLIFSLLGSEFFVLFLAPVIYWCYDPILGIRTGIYLLISGGLNTILKVLFHSPRPYWYSTDVKALSAESSFGEPSGHAQSSVIIWGTIALYIRKRWVWILSILMIFFISLSRVYLAVHFPTDILLGWIIGILLFGWCVLRSFLNWYKKFIYVKLFSFFGVIDFIVIFLLFHLDWHWSCSQAWIETADKEFQKMPIDPFIKHFH